VLERLQALGCDQAQGWLLGMPMDAVTAGAWIASRCSAHQAPPTLPIQPVAPGIDHFHLARHVL
jgi:hypothetical protein